MTPDEAQAERTTVFGILSDWVRAEHVGARRRNAVSFRSAQDIQDLWAWLHAERWKADQ